MTKLISFLGKNIILCFFLTLFLMTTSTTYGQSEQPAAAKRILFLGNSLTAGFGLDKDQAYPALIQNRLDSLKWSATAVNAGLSGETSAGGLRRINWLMRGPIDILVLALGANDGLRGISPDVTIENLQAIIDKVKKKNPAVKVIIAGMEAPPNMGEEYTSRFRNIFKSLAGKNDAALIPFLLEGVAGIKSLNLPDGIHPTAEGQLILRDNVWKILAPMLETMLEN